MSPDKNHAELVAGIKIIRRNKYQRQKDLADLFLGMYKYISSRTSTGDAKLHFANNNNFVHPKYASGGTSTGDIGVPK